MLWGFFGASRAHLALRRDPHDLKPGTHRESLVEGKPNERAHLPWPGVVPNPCDHLGDRGVLEIDVATPLWAKCEGEAHIPKSGKLESSGTPKNSEHNCRGQISLHLSALDGIEKVLKCRCPKWPRISHLDICSPS